MSYKLKIWENIIGIGRGDRKCRTSFAGFTRVSRVNRPTLDDDISGLGRHILFFSRSHIEKTTLSFKNKRAFEVWSIKKKVRARKPMDVFPIFWPLRAFSVNTRKLVFDIERVNNRLRTHVPSPRGENLGE